MPSKSHSLYEEAKKLIPGGSNLYSKRPEVHAPGVWPAYYESAEGITITDIDGHKYRDFSLGGIGACVLGYADPDVNNRVKRAIDRGSCSTLNSGEDVELAKLLTLLHPWAQQYRFTRSGGEAIAMAIRIAQAYAGREEIGYRDGSYHGWHVCDPRDGKEFVKNNKRHWNIAALIVEPGRLKDEEEELQRIREYTKEKGIVLIFDEISTGFRRNLGGSHLLTDVRPDIAVFGKAISNGYPIGVVIGTQEVMSACEKTFISSTSWSERTGPTAAIATIQKMWANDIFEHTKQIGEWVRGTIEWEAKRYGLDVQVEGHPQMLHIRFPNDVMRTFYTQLMLDKGFLAGKDFYAMYAHTIEDCEDFREAVAETFAVIANTHTNRVEVAESGIRR